MTFISNSRHISVVKKIKQNIWPSTDDTHSFDNLHS